MSSERTTSGEGDIPTLIYTSSEEKRHNGHEARMITTMCTIAGVRVPGSTDLTDDQDRHETQELSFKIVA
jgi:hypothetical protein